VNVTIPSGVTSGDNTLDISGPDSYSGEALIPIGTAASSSAASSKSALPAISLKGAVPKKLPKGETPRRKRPLPCLALGTGCRARVPE
jgi:hypothetical protein